MKVVILIGDGMADRPLPERGEKTPLQIAAIPNIRRAAGAGCVRQVKTVPAGMPPGSDVAILSIMGFDPARYYAGRAPIEAAGIGVDMHPNDVAFRCNLVTVERGLITDHSAGHITTREAGPLIEALDRELGRDGLRFVTGTGYRHLLIWRDGPSSAATTPPHDALGSAAEDLLPGGPRCEEIVKLMETSKAVLERHPVNMERRRAGKRPATQAWFWGQGRACSLPSYRETYGLSGGVISAVDLVRGIGRLAGLDVVNVPGATGFLDTNFAGKTRAALEVLREHDFVFVHLEAPDECSHMGSADLKIEAIEAFDREIVGPVLAGLASMGCDYRLVIGTDHRTPVCERKHSSEPVPVLLVRSPVPDAGAEGVFDEAAGDGRAPVMAYEWVQDILKRGGGCES